MTPILVIEDDVQYRLMLRHALTEAGYEVLEAADGNIGLELFQKHHCPLIIIDIFMPQKDGIDTIVDLKIEGVNAKIIAISGGGNWIQHAGQIGADGPLELAKYFGADRVLSKPIQIQALLATIAELLPARLR